MFYFLASWEKGAFLFYPAEAVVQRCSVKKAFLEISQNSQENTCARVSLLIKFHASGFFWIILFLIVEVSFSQILYEFHEIKLNVMKYTLTCVSWIVWKEYFTVYPRLKQTFHISHVRISKNVKDALMWNLALIIFMWRRTYWQIFKSALVYTFNQFYQKLCSNSLLIVSTTYL